MSPGLSRTSGLGTLRPCPDNALGRIFDGCRGIVPEISYWVLKHLQDLNLTGWDAQKAFKLQGSKRRRVAYTFGIGKANGILRAVLCDLKHLRPRPQRGWVTRSSSCLSWLAVVTRAVFRLDLLSPPLWLLKSAQHDCTTRAAKQSTERVPRLNKLNQQESRTFEQDLWAIFYAKVVFWLPRFGCGQAAESLTSSRSVADQQREWGSSGSFGQRKSGSQGRWLWISI